MASEQHEKVIQEEKGREEVSSEVEAAQCSSLNTKFCIKNLTHKVDNAQLAGIFQDYATPELIEVLSERETGRNGGYALVTMSSVADCNTILENLNGRENGGRTLRVNFSDKAKPKEPLYPKIEHKLFVGNLA